MLAARAGAAYTPPAAPGVAPQQGTPRPRRVARPAWGIVTSPSIGSNANQFNGVAARTSNDVWAVGYYTTKAATSPSSSTGTAATGASAPNPRHRRGR